MGLVADILDDIRSQIAVDNDALKEAKDRRNLVGEAATSFDGALRWFKSGSVAHATVNKPVTDADGGVVLDRRTHSDHGPDSSAGKGPADIVDDLCEMLGPLVRETYPNAKMRRSRRGVLVTFSSPIDDDQDPTVDLIPTLTRKDASGLWIPDLDDNTWSASDPEKHTDLFTGTDKAFRVHRARVVRFVKCWNKQWAPGNRALSSFNIEALGWEFVTDTSNSIDKAVAGLFTYAHDELDKGCTSDPAGVSDDIKLLLAKDTVLTRLKSAADRMEQALGADGEGEGEGDEDKVKDLMAGVFRDYVEAPDQSRSSLAAALRSGTAVGTASGIGTTGGKPLKPTRAFGRERDA
jgi:Second Messenger Oligonucleotide or Dinucleotide Synthetase domain